MLGEKRREEMEFSFPSWIFLQQWNDFCRSIQIVLSLILSTGMGRNERRLEGGGRTKSENNSSHLIVEDRERDNHGFVVFLNENEG